MTQSTFEKEMEKIEQYLVCKEDIFSAQSKARDGFILDCGLYFKKCRETGDICNPLEIMTIADKHFGKGG